MSLKDLRHSKWFDVAYRVGVAIKGVDGTVELLAGILLLIAPNTPHRLLLKVANEAGQHSGSIFRLFENSIIRIDGELTGGVLLFVIAFLIIHGVVKLVLVYALLKRIYKAYPYALGALVVLLIIQVIPLFSDPGNIGIWLFTILDVAIIYLVWGEYQDLREKVLEK